MTITSLPQFFATILSLSLFVSGKSVTLSNSWVAENEFLLPGIDGLSNIAPEGYTGAPLRWFGQAFPHGPNITIVGKDYEQIYTELVKMNPDFAVFNQAQLVEQPESPKVAKRQESVGLSLRYLKD